MIMMIDPINNLTLLILTSSTYPRLVTIYSRKRNPKEKKNNNKPHRSRQIQLNLCLLRKREKKIQENSKSNSGSIFPYEIENSSSVRGIIRVKVSFYLGDVLVKDVFDGVVI